jgi:hypothetical protein
LELGEKKKEKRRKRRLIKLDQNLSFYTFSGPVLSLHLVIGD